MKVQLVVVRGKPEGKVIPLLGPTFKIGRGETCHLRPNSEQVSREHAEFTIGENSVLVRDLGSRNGTLVNGKALTDVYRLKDRDLVQVGPLTFAVSIAGAPAPAPAAPAKTAGAAPRPAAVASGGGDEIDAWLDDEGSEPTADNTSGVYGGDTITIKAFRDAGSAPAKPPSASDDEYERQVDDEGDAVDHLAETADDLGTMDEDAATAEVDAPDEEVEEEEEEAEEEEAPDEFIDESNPFYVAKKAQQTAKAQAKAKEAAGPAAKGSSKDSSDAAGDILRRLMERRRASRDE